MVRKRKNLSITPGSVASGRGRTFVIIVSRWNEAITASLLDGAQQTLLQQGCAQRNIEVLYVPGSFELPAAAALAAVRRRPDAILCLGCVIQGETRHFEFISQAVAQGLTDVSVQHQLPVIFGVLTTDTYRQAQDRAGGRHGNKGVEAALTALQMAELFGKLRKRSR
jgi:6,7-dimethyl-8-ribityllumazine synthase